MSGGIDGDGGKTRRSAAAKKRTENAMRTCQACGRRSVMRRTWLGDLGRHLRTCRYCHAEYVAAPPAGSGAGE